MHPSAKGHTAWIGGTTLHWVEMGEGEGPPVVLLHGLCDSHRTWSRVAHLIAEKRRVLALDLPGYGLSDRPDAPYTLEWQARIVTAWLDALGLKEIDIVGHSYGGGVAQCLLLVSPGRVRRMVLVATGGLGREVLLGVRLLALGRLVEVFGQPFVGIATHLTTPLLGGDFTREEIGWLAWANAMPGTARSMVRTVRDVVDWRGQRRHLYDQVNALDLPALALFWGVHDPVVPFSHAKEVTKVLDGVNLVRFDAGHYPHREHPEAFLRSLNAFLDAPHVEPARVRRVLVHVPRKRGVRGAIKNAIRMPRAVMSTRA